MRLTEPRPDLEAEFRAMAEEWREAGRDVYAAALADFDGYLQKLARQKEEEGLPPGRVPSCTFWLLADGSRVVGTSRLRSRLLPHLEKEGGHIGYDVRPSERRRGCGTALLALTLDEARDRGLSEVLITCDHGNVGSVRVIENNGGRLLDQVVSDRTGNTVNRYGIVL